MIPIRQMIADARQLATDQLPDVLADARAELARVQKDVRAWRIRGDTARRWLELKREELRVAEWIALLEYTIELRQLAPQDDTPEPATDTEPVSVCDNCGTEWADDELNVVSHIFERVAPGEPMPSGECPSCGAVCHPKAVAGGGK